MNEAIATAVDREIFNSIHASAWGSQNQLAVYRQGCTPQRHSLSDLQSLVAATAHRLAEMGLRRHDRIGILLHNCLEWVLLDLAALRLGIVTAGFEVEQFGRNRNLLGDYDLRFLFYGKDCEAVQGAGRHAVGLDQIAADCSKNSLDRVEGPPSVHYEATDVTTIKFTSGSTGGAKGLPATVGSIEQSLNAVQSLFHHRQGDKLFVFLPLSLLQQRYWVYSAIAFSHDVVISSPALALETLRKEQPTVVMGVPAFFEMLKARIEAVAAGLVDLPRAEAVRAAAHKVLGPNVRYLWTGSAPARLDVLAFFDDLCGIPLFEGYGMNETCIVTKNHPGAHRRGSVGRPLDGISVWIDAGGIVRVKRRHPVSHAYLYARPGMSEQIFCADGSVITGDLGRLDEDGYLYIMGRADDVVVLENGRNVAVRPLEEKINQDPLVVSSMVLGTGRPFLAAIVCPVAGADGAAVRSAVLRDGVADNGETVNAIVISDEPFSLANGLLTSQGKLRRAAIAERYSAEIKKAYGEIA